jgi:hypothetical protein
LIASQYTFQFHGRGHDEQERLRLERQEYEKLRAQKIVDNPGIDPEPPVEEEKTVSELLQEGFEEEQKQLAEEEAKEEPVETAEKDKEFEEVVHDNGPLGPTPVTFKEKQEDLKKKEPLELSEELSDIEQWNNWVAAAEAEVAKEEMQARIQRVQEIENDPTFKDAKERWKAENPGEKIKTQKNLYIRGMISKLPWENFQEQLRAKPDLTEVIEPEGYVQNSEQSENSVWNRIKRDSE